MKSNKLLFFLLLCVLLAGCGGGGGGSGSTAPQNTLISIVVAPGNPSLAQGSTQQFTALATFPDGTTQDLTSTATWTSSNPLVASVSSTGVATAFATGTVTITATANGTSGSASLTTTGGAANVVALTVNGSLCSETVGFRYPNKPCVSVTVCTPGTSTCQTINDILLDTGSYGLRIFQQAVSVPLTAVINNAGSIAECVQFVDGSSLWGPVQTASVILGQEPAVQVPVQVIDATFGALPAACNGAEPSPSSAGFKGILGLGVFEQDCGPSCANSTSNGMYYVCNGASCSGASVPLSNQVRNPVAMLPQDNNGVMVQLPAISSSGAASANGNLILGIGTQANNSPSGVTRFPVNGFGDFVTTLGGVSYSSFIDSGSNGIFFTPSPSVMLQVCSSPNAAWFCPPSTMTLTATTTGASGSPASTAIFQIGNFNALLNSSNNAFNDIGGPMPGGNQFDWGLPFFYGRNVFVGLQGKDSSLGVGPYWAY